MDLAALPNRGVYPRPAWVKQIKLTRADNGHLALAFPPSASPKKFIRILQSAPKMEVVEPIEEDEELVEELIEPVVPGAAVSGAAQPVMDPATPEFKRAAMVKQDDDKKPFDFMSNRPVPRAKTVETPVVEEVVEEVVETVVAPIVKTFVEPVVEPVVEKATLAEEPKNLADKVAKIRQKTEVDEVKWRHAPITDVDVKFAVSPLYGFPSLAFLTLPALQTPPPTHRYPHL
jgi:hypothetical protein